VNGACRAPNQPPKARCAAVTSGGEKPQRLLTRPRVIVCLVGLLWPSSLPVALGHSGAVGMGAEPAISQVPLPGLRHLARGPRLKRMSRVCRGLPPRVSSIHRLPIPRDCNRVARPVVVAPPGTSVREHTLAFPSARRGAAMRGWVLRHASGHRGAETWADVCAAAPVNCSDAAEARCRRNAGKTPHHGSSRESMAKHRQLEEPWTLQHLRAPGSTARHARRLFQRPARCRSR